MADTKISQFPSAGTLTGTEALPAVQSGVNAKIPLSTIRDFCRVRQDCTVVQGVHGLTGYWNLNNRPVRASNGVYYTFFRGDSDGDLHCTTSTNYGVTWAVPTGTFLIKVGTITQFAVWYDKWTPGDSGNLIHICYADEIADTIWYRTIDTTNNTVSAEVTVGSAAVIESSSSCMSIVKTHAGRIAIAYDVSGTGVNGCVKSNDYPPTGFTAINNGLHEGAVSDYYALFPSNETDPADFCAGFWDRSADGISIKTYDDSANTWSEVVLAADGTMAEPSAGSATNWSIATRLSDSHTILVAWNNNNNAGSRLRAWDITNGTTFTALTDVLPTTPFGNQNGAAVSLDGASNITVYYVGSSDGSETTTKRTYKRVSSNAGTSWSAEIAVSDVLRPLAHVLSSPDYNSMDHLVMTVGNEYASTGFRCRALS